MKHIWLVAIAAVGIFAAVAIPFLEEVGVTDIDWGATLRAPWFWVFLGVLALVGGLVAWSRKMWVSRLKQLRLRQETIQSQSDKEKKVEQTQVPKTLGAALTQRDVVIRQQATALVEWRKAMEGRDATIVAQHGRIGELEDTVSHCKNIITSNTEEIKGLNAKVLKLQGELDAAAKLTATPLPEVVDATIPDQPEAGLPAKSGE